MVYNKLEGEGGSRYLMTKLDNAIQVSITIINLIKSNNSFTKT